MFQIVRVRHAAIHGKKDSRFAVALDSDQNNIMVNDVVKVVDGPNMVGEVTEIKLVISCNR